MTLDKAISLTAQKFEGVNDKGGVPYILHCLHVMMEMIQMYPRDAELHQIAVMHDLIEDTDVTVKDLMDKGFSERVCAALICLTHKQGEDYDVYIRRVATNEDARKVKLADLRHNSDITRLKGLTEKDFLRAQKYQRSYEYLRK